MSNSNGESGDLSQSEKAEEVTQSTSPPRETHKSPKLTEVEALEKLEDHRCAICNAILINACRIDCGHTFCQHCLNVDREKLNDRGKPTCFICDAAITEIGHNTDRDKEIDKLYSALPVDKQLSRARQKAERKAEEERFASTPKSERLLRNSQDSNGNGPEADHNDNVEGASWREYNREQEENNQYSSEEHGAPSCYCVDSHPYWPHSVHHHHHNFHPSYADSGLETSAEGYDGMCQVPQEPSDVSQHPHHPHHPIVIHHTVQHVFHTVEVHQERSNAVGMEDNMNHQTPPESLDWNSGSEQFYGPLRHRDRRVYPPPAVPFSNHNCHCGNSMPVPVYSYRGCCNPYGGPQIYQPFPGGYPSTIPATSYPSSPSDDMHHGSMYSNDPLEHSLNHFSEDEDYSQEHYETSQLDDEGNCENCETLCDFHRAMLEQEQREISENLAAHSRASLLYARNDNAPGPLMNEETDHEYMRVDDHLANHNHEMVSLNVRIPFPIPSSRNVRTRSRRQSTRRRRCSSRPREVPSSDG